jgi:hypothetical protein
MLYIHQYNNVYLHSNEQFQGRESDVYLELVDLGKMIPSRIPTPIVCPLRGRWQRLAVRKERGGVVSVY